MTLINLIFGRRLATDEGESQKIGALYGVPAMGLDGLASAAYGPEAALAILTAAGMAGIGAVVPITGLILVLLGLLYFSYLQTISAYPNGGGSYVVASENLGSGLGLLSAAALMIDYVLNVAVGISTGIGALISAVPSLQPFTLWLCLAALGLLTLANLRGTREAGLIFAIPTYLFFLSLAGMLAWGVWRSFAGAATPVIAPPAVPSAKEAVGIWLLLRAFAAGCTAMTGVEAVSNGVTAFKDPVEARAKRTLTAICAMLAVLLLGIGYLAPIYHIAATDQSTPGYQSVLSQLGHAILGNGILYDITLATVLIVPCLSANTSFTGFPRLCRIVAKNGFLPHVFAIPGRRLVYTAGVLFLTVSAGLLLTAFDGVTDRLIPLFAVGAFLAFTLSQAGMAAHWWRALREKKDGGWGLRLRLGVNALGALATGLALAVIVVAKFMEGAWITILAIPLTLLLLMRVQRYYGRVKQRVRAGDIDFDSIEPPVVIIPVENWNRLTDKALKFAMRISPDVIAVHLIALEGDADDREESLRKRWREVVEAPLAAAGCPRPIPRLVQLRSPYRRLPDPLMKFIGKLSEETDGRPIAVLVPLLVKQHWWQHLLHSRRAHRLQEFLLREGSDRVMVISVPWRLDPDEDGRKADPAAVS